MKPSDYTFETFVAKSSNSLAQLAAKKICEAPNSFNPLHIYGPPGVGKSHLLQDVANEYPISMQECLQPLILIAAYPVSMGDEYDEVSEAAYKAVHIFHTYLFHPGE